MSGQLSHSPAALGARGFAMVGRLVRLHASFLLMLAALSWGVLLEIARMQRDQPPQTAARRAKRQLWILRLNDGHQR